MLILGAITGQKSVQKEPKTGVPATYGNKWFRYYVICYVSAMSDISTKSYFYGNSGCQIRVRTDVKKKSLPRHTLEAQVVTLWPQDQFLGPSWGPFWSQDPSKRGLGMHAYTLRVPRWL